MGCEMSKALKQNASKTPAVSNPRELTIISVYPEKEGGHFLEVNTLTRSARVHDLAGESPSQLFLPTSNELTKTTTDSNHVASLNIDIPDVSVNDDYTDEDEDCSHKSVKMELFSAQQQQLLPPCSPLKSLKSSKSSGMLNAVVNMVVRPSSGRFPDYLLQGRSIFQSPVRKLAHPFEFPQQSPKKPKMMNKFQSKNSFEVLH